MALTGSGEPSYKDLACRGLNSSGLTACPPNMSAAFLPPETKVNGAFRGSSSTQKNPLKLQMFYVLYNVFWFRGSYSQTINSEKLHSILLYYIFQCVFQLFSLQKVHLPFLCHYMIPTNHMMEFKTGFCYLHLTLLLVTTVLCCDPRWKHRMCCSCVTF